MEIANTNYCEKTQPVEDRFFAGLNFDAHGIFSLKKIPSFIRLPLYLILLPFYRRLQHQ